MVIFHVRHYLNNNGINYFDRWFNNLVIALNNYAGFIAAKYSIDDENKIINLFLEFETLESLQCWRESTEHKKIKLLLREYQVSNYGSDIYQINNFSYASKLKKIL